MPHPFVHPVKTERSSIGLPAARVLLLEDKSQDEYAQRFLVATASAINEAEQRASVFFDTFPSDEELAEITLDTPLFDQEQQDGLLFAILTDSIRVQRELLRRVVAASDDNRGTAIDMARDYLALGLYGSTRRGYIGEVSLNTEGVDAEINVVLDYIDRTEARKARRKRPIPDDADALPSNVVRFQAR
jgi:hypothetical protein